MQSLESVRVQCSNGSKLTRQPELGLYCGQREVNHIRKPESTGAQEILGRLPSEQKADGHSNLLDELDRHDIQVSEKFLYERLQVCISKKNLELGRQVQAFIQTCGQRSNPFLASHLIRMFSCCGSLSEAYLVFCKLPAHNVFTWSAIIAAYASNGQNDEACNLFKDMLQSSIKPDEVTFVVILKACASISSLIGGYVQNQNGQEALLLFQQMQLCGEQGDNVTYVNTLNACSTTAAVEQGQLIHACLVEGEFQVDTFLGSALIDMYASHGKLEDAGRVFETLLERDVGVWNAIIESCTISNNHKLAMYYIKGMQMENLMPDDITFVCLLSMCSHMGLLEEGWHQLKLMIGQYGILPIVEHYNCIIDLLGRSGLLAEAENVLQNMPWQPTLKSWMSLLSNCKSYGNVAFGFHCFKQVFLLDCTHGSAYTLMWTLFSGAGLFLDASKLVELSKHVQAWRKPGKAYIEIAQNLHEFVVGETTHPSFHACYRKLKELRLHGSCEGCMPQLDLFSC